MTRPKSFRTGIEKMIDNKDINGLVISLEAGNPSLREAAAFALGEIGGNKALEPLEKALDDDNSDVRWAAALVLGREGDERPTEAIQRALKDEGEDAGKVAERSTDEMEDTKDNKIEGPDKEPRDEGGTLDEQQFLF